MDVKIILKIHLQQNVSKQIRSGFSLSTISSFRSIEKKHDVHRVKDCIFRSIEKKYDVHRVKIESLREHAMKIISFKKKKMNSVTKVNRMKLQKSVIFVKKNMKINI